MTKQTSKSVRITAETYETLKALGDKTQIPLTRLITIAVNEYAANKHPDILSSQSKEGGK